MTEIREPNFGIDLPGEWQQAKTVEDGSYVYREEPGSGIFSVTLLAVRPMFAIADQQRLLEDYMQHRAKYEAGQTASLENGEHAVMESGGVLEGRWDGADAQAGRRVRHRVLLVDGVLGDFRFEAPAEEPEGFDDRADAILVTATLSAG